MFTFFVDSRSIKKPRKKPSYKRVLISDPTDNQIFLKTPRVVKENGKKKQNDVACRDNWKGRVRCSFERVAKGRRRYPDKGWESEEEQEEWITLRIFFFSFLFYSFEKRTTGARAHAFDSICSDDFAR